MSEPITKERAIELLREVVQGKEDYKYSSPIDDGFGTCVYEFDGKPSCGVGYALYLHDPDLFNRVAKYDNTKIAAKLAGVFAEITPEAALVFDLFQGMQDVGVPWGKALERTIAGER